MSVQGLFYIFAGGLPLGFFLSLFWDYLERRAAIRRARAEGEHFLLSAQERAEAALESRQKEFQRAQEGKISNFEKEKKALASRIREMRAGADKKAHQLELKSRENRIFFKKLKGRITQIQEERKENISQRALLRERLKEYELKKIQKLKSHFSIDLDQLKESLKKDLEENWITRVRKEMEDQNKQDKQNLQKDSFLCLYAVLSRFDRVYCPERGIRPVSFKNDRHLEKALGPDRAFLNEIEKECGVDILINKEDRQASVFGIDPVRRELGRMVLAKLAKKSKLDIPLIQKTVRISKKDLFAQIRRDGRQICRRLRLKNVAVEAQNMMGALRYRYSFAQNQYFHCEEAGWLCGLLSAELGLAVPPGQRAGMFHDIGKAMDHSIEGNHAVIGAEFLAKYGEEEEILHPVRAHHHDEQPSTALAYLVIVADSISGSRPGARRFTEDSYNQKMANLERIIDSFDNIEDAYIMSAGREMRVIVDDKRVSDREALDLSRLIAGKIERECSYPGLIKVTVVRHSEKSAIA